MGVQVNSVDLKRVSRWLGLIFGVLLASAGVANSFVSINPFVGNATFCGGAQIVVGVVVFISCAHCSFE
jgi:hypothetical protein